ncbi:MAG: radical SAM protein [Candidatus Omnitrophica bacterium]|nr:radical SAM protein [Candidatus Omnitrophota bacterium]
MKKITNTPIVTPHNDMTMSLPTTVHIELTSSCCFTCRHCYNFWRKGKAKPVFISQEQLDRILDELIDTGIMHVIFTGGEPLLNNAVLLHGIKKMKDAGASVTCNSTLAVANTLEQMKKLHAAGLEHILTSLNSHKPDINDHLVSVKGAHQRIVAGIKNAVSAGIRISVNMIISKTNISDIYETARLAHSLGAKKFFGTRVVPHISKNASEQSEFIISEKDARFILDELLRVEKDFGMQVGTLIPFPFCMMVEKEEDLVKFEKFYSHGCPSGNKMISLNANGDAHACVHESMSYGNILDIGIKGVWANMNPWRSGEYFPDECKACVMFERCNGGCRLCAFAYNGTMKSADNLRKGWKFAMPVSEDELGDMSLTDTKCLVPQNMRFRKEDGFYIADRFGSEILCVKNEIALVLRDYQKKGKAFFPKEAGLKDPETVRSLLKEKLLLKEDVSK